MLSCQATMMSDVKEKDPINPTMADVSAAYEDIFTKPTVLPPKRDCDHAIHLKGSSNIPNIRLYQYPYYRKTNIEKFVQEMTVGGIIRPNNSSYSSTII